MDRDMVNCLHYIYQWGEITPAELGRQPRIFWCNNDTRRPLSGRGVIVQQNDRDPVTFAPGVYDLIDMVENQLRTLPRPDFAFGYPISAQIRQPAERRPAFLAISYDPSFKPVEAAVLAAADRAGFHCEVTGNLSAPGPIMDQVWQGIRGSDAVVADITGNNPNVFYEIGLAHALGKEVILLAQDAAAPFDIRSSRRITYSPADLPALERDLESAFRAVSARYPFEGPEPRF